MSSPPDAPPHPPAPPRRFVRRTDDRILGGVASGLADLMGVDPVLVRVGFVLLAFAGGAGIVGYLALWVLTPEGVPGGPRPATPDRGAAFWVAIALFVLAALALADTIGDRSVVWPLVLIGAGIALWRTDLRGRPTAPPTWTAPAQPPQPPDATTEQMAMPSTTTAAGPTPPPHAAETAPTTPTTSAWTPPPPPGGRRADRKGGDGWSPPRERERSILGRLTLGLALVTLGVLTALDRLGVFDLTVRDAMAVALLVVGLGLVVGTWLGRARWLSILAALLLLPGLVLSTALHEMDVPLGSGIGERSFGTTAVADVQPTYELGVGSLRLDFANLDMAEETVETTARVGLGQIEITVPEDATIVVHYDITGGRVELFGNAVEGQPVRGTQVFNGEPGAGRLELTVEVALGQVEVNRGPGFGGVSRSEEPGVVPPVEPQEVPR